MNQRLKNESADVDQISFVNVEVECTDENETTIKIAVIHIIAC